MTPLETLLPKPVLDLYNACGVKPYGFLSFREKFPTSEAARKAWWFEGVYDAQYDFIAINEGSQIPFARLGLHELVHWTGHPNRLARERIIWGKAVLEGAYVRHHPGIVQMDHTEEAIAETGMIKLAKILGLWTPELQGSYEGYLSMHPMANMYAAERESDRAIQFILDQKQISLDSALEFA